MKIENLTNPGVDPVDGDLIRITYPNGSTEEKYYWTPYVNPAPGRKEVILARLVEIDTISDKPRTRRELALSKKATKDWLQSLDDEAAALRTELGTLP